MPAIYDSITGGGSVAALETKFRTFVGTRFAVAMTNATSALHAALLASGVERGDEVIVPAYTWGGTLTGVLQIGAFPVFADIDETLTLDPQDVAAKITDKTKAVIVVHLFGHPGYCLALRNICQNAGIALIEDCAQAFGAREDEQPVGSFGTGCFSFSAEKILNVGEGAMLTTDDETVFDRVLYYTQHPLRQRKDGLEIRHQNQFALNYRLASSLAEAALGKFDNALEEISKRTEAFAKIAAEIGTADFPWLEPVTVRDSVSPSWHRYSPTLPKEIKDNELNYIQWFLGNFGYRLENGYISAPLYRDAELYEYLPLRIGRKMKRYCLPNTELACRTRVGIGRIDSGFTE
jgi:perosamine synthetase